MGFSQCIETCLVIVFWPDSSECFASTDVIDLYVEPLVLGVGSAEPHGRNSGLLPASLRIFPGANQATAVNHSYNSFSDQSFLIH